MPIETRKSKGTCQKELRVSVYCSTGRSWISSSAWRSAVGVRSYRHNTAPRTTDACSWEKLSQEEIDQVFRTVREELPDIDRKIQALGGVAARSIVRGLQLYGCTGSELSEGKSKLMSLIGKEIDVQQLCGDQVVTLTKVLSPTSDQHDAGAIEQPDTVALRRFARSHLGVR